MATGTIKKPMHIEYGDITDSTISIPASGEKEIKVDFDQTFATAPVVVASISKNTSYSDRQLYLNQTVVTTTDVTFKVRNPYSQAVTLSASRKISWVAIG